MKIAGKYKNIRIVLFCSCLFSLFSCRTINQDISKHNYFIGDFFYNDSIKVSIDFLGNIIQEDLSDIKYHQLKKELRQVKGISLNNLFIKCHPERNNRFNMYYFYEKTDFIGDTLTRINKIKEDEENNIAVFEKQKGDQKVICVVKSFIKNDFENTLSRVKKCIDKVHIDSVVSDKISYLKIFNYYTTPYHNYLEARKKINTAPISVKNDKNYYKYQFLRTVNSYIGNNKEYDSLITIYESKRKEKYNDFVNSISEKSDVFIGSDVFNKIEEIGAQNKIIIVNEDHNYPSHRIFGMEMLSVLQKTGFKYISLEAFVSDGKTKFIPNKNNGVYIDEPYFAHFIRKAKDLGFIILGHENYEDNIDRELGQAKNIMKILENDPEAKIFLYVGQSHLEKTNNKKKWMAQYLKELSGINPVTINQATVLANNKEELMLIPSSSFKEGPDTKSSADYFLVNRIKPCLQKIYKELPFHSVTLKDLKFERYNQKEILIEVVDYKEYNLIGKSAIPIKRDLVTANGKKISLELPVGQYHIFIKPKIIRPFMIMI